MFIEPNTNIRILKNVPLDTTYKNTLYFTSATEQANYFIGLTKHNMVKYTYQRVQKGVARVGIKADLLYDCNYMMFQNTNFGTKWFYAFITGVEYINNDVSAIKYDIDVLQTWNFDYTLKECFVEREHVEDDIIGNNTVPEKLETGPYITTSTGHLLVSDLAVYVLATEKLELNFWNEPGIVGGFPIPCYWVSLSAMSTFSVEVLRNILDTYASAGKADSIVAVFTAPYNMVSTQAGVREQTFECAKRKLAYTPRNNKLYTYPYCCLTANALGQGVELRYELFDSVVPTMKVTGGFGANMQVVCAPQGYGGQTENLEYCLSIKDFPICAWVTDYYQNWLAQNKASIVTSTVNSVVSAVATGAVSVATGNPVGVIGSVISGVSGVANTIANVYEHSIIPDKLTGSANAADILSVSKRSGFYTFCKAIRPEYARIIDDYFDIYGYAIHRVKVPNISSRPHWNYVKTIDCTIVGSVPADDMKKICGIYDRGVTFWKDGAEVGNYSLDNKPIMEEAIALTELDTKEIEEVLVEQ